MRRALIAISVAVALLVASCGSSADPAATTLATDGTASSTTEASSTPTGPPAPDFSLALGEDGSADFVLSQEVMPVFMVFWAEW